VFRLLRTSGASVPLQVTAEHERLVTPRRGPPITWSLDRGAFSSRDLARGIEAWQGRAFTEFHSLTLFTQLASQVQALGAPLDWSGAFARIIADEVRHTDYSLRLSEALGGPGTLDLEAAGLHQPTPAPQRLRAHVRGLVIAAFCIGETLSGRMFRRALQVATEPLAREVVKAILVDESFHAEFGWEVGALLMREHEGFAAERAELASELPRLFQDFARQCCVTGSRAWTHAQPDTDGGANFGTLSNAGYAQAFYDGMEADVVPGLEAIGLPEAQAAWKAFVAQNEEDKAFVAQNDEDKAFVAQNDEDKAFVAQNDGNKAFVAQNDGNKAFVAQNDGNKAFVAQNDEDKAFVAQNDGNKAFVAQNDEDKAFVAQNDSTGTVSTRR
jgi:hypothetical protein